MTLLFVFIFLLIIAFWLLPPLLFDKTQSLERVGLSLDVRLQQLKQDYQFKSKEFKRRLTAGELDDSEWQQLNDELRSEVATSIELTQSNRTTKNVQKSPITAIIMMLLVTVMAFGVYQLTGAATQVSEQFEMARQLSDNPDFISQLENEAVKKNDEASIAELLGAVRLQVEISPEKASSWLDYGRIYTRIGRHEEALEALYKARDLDANNSEISLQLAQSMASSENPKLNRQAIFLIQQVLKKEPNHQGALLFLGFTAFQQQQYSLAIDSWEKAIESKEPGSEPVRLLKRSIEAARSRLAATTSQVVEQSGSSIQPEIVENPGLTVRVKIAESVRKQLTGDEIIFVYAKAANGPPMPLAVYRDKVSNLKDKIILSDKDAMQPQLKLSNFEKIQVIARISQTGVANGQSGDFEGKSQIIKKPYSKEQIIVINSMRQ